ncbi:hypothetical protein PFISCL1PPCAC_23041, partial [Pristionchus fissidentatus]
GEMRESIRVYKELVGVLQDRSVHQETKRKLDFARAQMIGTFKTALQMKGALLLGPALPIGTSRAARALSNNSANPFRVLYANEWAPEKSLIVCPNTTINLEAGNNKYLYVAPVLSEDPMDGSELVSIYRADGECYGMVMPLGISLGTYMVGYCHYRRQHILPFPQSCDPCLDCAYVATFVVCTDWVICTII